MNNCTKYGFNNLIISGSYGGHRRHTTDAGRRTTPWVWHKLPTGELKIIFKTNSKRVFYICTCLYIYIYISNSNYINNDKFKFTFQIQCVGSFPPVHCVLISYACFFYLHHLFYWRKVKSIKQVEKVL